MSLSRRRRTRAYRKTRAQALHRDGHCCVCCGVGGVALEVDHITPILLGGTDELKNLRTLCIPCHADRQYAPADPRVDDWDALIRQRWGL